MGLDTSVLLRAEVSGYKGDRKEAKRRQEDIDESVWSHFNHAQQCAESKIEGFFSLLPTKSATKCGNITKCESLRWVISELLPNIKACSLLVWC